MRARRWGIVSFSLVVGGTGCSGKTIVATDGGVPSSSIAPGDGAPPVTASDLLEECGDGTGLHDCCSAEAVGGAPCDAPDARCWTRCVMGNRGQLACGDGIWTAGKGLFPCEAAPTRAAARGAISLHFATPSDPLKTCVPGPHWINVPDDPQGGPVTSDQSSDKRAIAGDPGVSVACTVYKSGPLFFVRADIQTKAVDPNGKNLLDTSLHLLFTTGSDTATGSLRVLDDRSQSVYRSDNCQFAIKSLDANGTLAIAPGRVWGTVRCDELSSEGSPDLACGLDSGFFVFENCRP